MLRQLHTLPDVLSIAETDPMDEVARLHTSCLEIAQLVQQLFGCSDAITQQTHDLADLIARYLTNNNRCDSSSIRAALDRTISPLVAFGKQHQAWSKDSVNISGIHIPITDVEQYLVSAQSCLVADVAEEAA